MNMSDDKKPERPLTNAQKEHARKFGMTEKEYSSATEALIAKGKIKREDIR